MCPPAGARHQLDGCFLKRAGDEEVIHQAHGRQALKDRSTSGDGSHPEAGGPGLGQRGDGDDVAVDVVADQRGRRRRSVPEPTGPVVFQDEGPGGGGRFEDLRATVGGEPAGLDEPATGFRGSGDPSTPGPVAAMNLWTARALVRQRQNDLGMVAERIRLAYPSERGRPSPTGGERIFAFRVLHRLVHFRRSRRGLSPQL